MLFKRTSLLWLLLAGVMFFFSGCSYKNKNILFKTEQKIKTRGLPVYHANGDDPGAKVNHHIIRPDDRISVRFLNNFDIDKGVTIAGSASTGDELSFLVDRNGEVVLPLIGRVNIEGYDRVEAAAMLEKKYAETLQKPNIEVLILGRSVSVMGEVLNPGLFDLRNERTTLVEMVAKAGGITKYGKLKDVKLIRTKPDGTRELIIFDLTKESSLGASEMILQDKDIVYVEPRGITLVSNAITPYSSILSLIVSIGTVVLIFVRTSSNTN